MGWYESELIRHVDPARRTLGRFFADEVAAQLGLEVYIGLPASVDRERVAYVHGWPRAEALLHLHTMPAGFALALLNPFGLASKTVKLPTDVDVVRTVEMPAANGIGTARSVASAEGCAATGGTGLALTPTALDALTQPAVAPSGGVRDRVLHVDSSFSPDYCKPVRHFIFGSSGRAFSTPGYGGSFGFADPDTGESAAMAPRLH